METKPLSMNELKYAFYSLKSNKNPAYGDISYNVIKKCFGSLREPLKYLFNLSIEKCVFPDDLKIVRSTPIYKVEDSSDVSNYRPISALTGFSNSKYTLGVFIDQSKVFDTVEHSILLKKLELHGITNRNHGCVKNYLSNKRQFVQINEKEKDKLRDDQLWCSIRVHFRTTPICYVCE